MLSSGMLHFEALVRTDVLEERSASIIRATRIRKVETTLTVTRNQRTLRRYTLCVRRLLVIDDVVHSSLILVTRWRSYFTSKRRSLQEPQGVASQKTAFFLVTAITN
jgi:hypothetical protein